MLFPTTSFFFFFLCVFVGFWYVFRRSLDRRIFLIAASYVFYAFWDWRFCFLLLASTAANYGFGLLVGGNRDHVWRKTFMILSVVFNVLVLGFFKYYTIFAETSNGLLALHTSASFRLPVIYILLPVGISYFTFKCMSYVFDVYLCKMPTVRSFLDVMLYVSFFPQIASGPIVQASEFIPQIDKAVSSGIDPYEKPIEFDRATLLILSGLIKKMVFANFISTLLVDPVFSGLASAGPLAALFAALGYAVVIYCDFSGYSDMAIGIALLLGFDTPANFNRPYVSFSVTEFWKRWHITFSSWLKNYLYFSMGGSRFGTIRTLFALFFTMVIGGLWHGASVPFLVWGAMQGAALAIERAFGYGNTRSPRLPVAIAQTAGSFLFVVVSWLVFRARSLAEIGLFFRAVFPFLPGTQSAVDTSSSTASTSFIFSPVVLILVFIGLAMHAVPGSVRGHFSQAYRLLPLPVKGVCIALVLALISVVSMSGVAPFIYFSF